MIIKKDQMLNEILRQQYEFSKWFRKYGFNNSEEQIDYAFQNAYNIIEESIECCRNCDSRKYWKLDYNNNWGLNYLNLLEEIIDIVKFTLNWIFDLTVLKENVIQKQWEFSTTHQKIREFFGVNETEWNDLVEIFKVCYNKLLLSEFIVPSINEKVKESNTISTVRKIIQLTSNIEELDYQELKSDLTTKKANEILEKNLDTTLKILQECFNLWIFWNVEDDSEEEFNNCWEKFFEAFSKKSNKNIKRQKRGTEEQANHWNED